MHPFEYHLPFQSVIMAVNFQSGIGESWWIILRPLYVLQSWTGPWDTPTPWDRAHFSLPQQQMFQFFELNTSIIVLSIFTESLIKLHAKVPELFEKECILGLKTIS